MSRVRKRAGALEFSHSKNRGGGDSPRSLRRSVSVYLAPTYLPVAALISTCRILPSTGDVPRIIIGRERSVRTHTHNAQCVIIVTSMIKWSRTWSRPGGNEIKCRTIKSQGKPGFSMRYRIFFLLGDTRWRKSPRKDDIQYYVESGDRSRSLFFFLSLFLIV